MVLVATYIGLNTIIPNIWKSNIYFKYLVEEHFLTYKYYFGKIFAYVSIF